VKTWSAQGRHRLGIPRALVPGRSPTGPTAGLGRGRPAPRKTCPEEPKRGSQPSQSRGFQNGQDPTAKSRTGAPGDENRPPSHPSRYAEKASPGPPSLFAIASCRRTFWRQCRESVPPSKPSDPADEARRQRKRMGARISRRWPPASTSKSDPILRSPPPGSATETAYSSCRFPQSTSTYRNTV
jgi:hypothetical protein